MPNEYQGAERRSPDQRALLDEEQLDELARRSADKAARKVFAILGVDLDKPESIESFRDDLRFGRRLRKAADHGFLVLVGALAVGLVALLGLGIVAKFKQ